MQRPGAARFGAGAYAFPGGAIDGDDASAVWESRLPPVGERTACAAALRELFEETGIVPACAGPVDSGRRAAARQALLANQTSFSRIAERMKLDFSAAGIVYFARWITPMNLALRFDTRFFLLAADEQIGPVSLSPEHDAALWTTLAAALRRFAAGELPMLFPTVRTIERLAGLGSPTAALEALRDVRVEPVLVKLAASVGEKEARSLAPGDPGYDEIS